MGSSTVDSELTARCATGDHALREVFFSHEEADVVLAQAVCRGCAIVADCLDGAVERREPIGVWGGMVFHDGRALDALPRRGRPAKDPAPRPVVDESKLAWLVA